jgi:putative membrane protein
VTRTTAWLSAVGVVLFVGVLAAAGPPALIFNALSGAAWGLLLLAAVHLVPLGLDAAAIRVLFGTARRGAMRAALLARWAGESANSLLPAGQLGGPVLMARQLAHGGMPLQDAAAAVTVNTTLQVFAQIGFALLGVALLGMRAGDVSGFALRNSALLASLLLAVVLGCFYVLQRRRLFARLVRTAGRFFRRVDRTPWLTQAEAIDLAVQRTYRRSGPVAASISLNLAGWLVGTAEVFLILPMLGFPVGWGDALLLESLGQSIRGAAFAIPGALGVQEGGYLLLAPAVGMPPDVALALSLAKRAREILLGVPGLLYVLLSERVWRRRIGSCDNVPPA